MKTNFDANLLNLKLYTINTILEINTYHYHFIKLPSIIHSNPRFPYSYIILLY